ncbi:MAG: stage II sporulation protein P [Syntrophomonadaceae bacterium]|nr:stage II sporulation protein P [Syntrophomonadaceae bacterium]
MFNPLNWMGFDEVERLDGGYYALVDEQGKVIDQTALRVFKGDEYIDADNRRYRVKDVTGDIAHCEFVGIESLAWEDTELPLDGETTVPVAATKPLVGLYHTHGDESYKPSQGVSSMPPGKKSGVAIVAATLKDKLEAQGIPTIYNEATHDPHDSGAYHRSRRTATALMKKGAKVLIDVHRDAVPPEVYQTEIKGESATKIRLVVGRRNPNSSANLGYAKQIKARTDETHPGLAKGIFIGRGVYNQDLRPTNLLIEVGADKNSLEDAQKGVALFAEVLPQITGINPQTGARQVKAGEDAGGNLKALGGLLVALIFGGFGYLLISTGSLEGTINKLKHFGSSEWTNFFGRRRTKEIIREEEIIGPLADSADSDSLDSVDSTETTQDLSPSSAEPSVISELEYIWEPSVELSPEDIQKTPVNKKERVKGDKHKVENPQADTRKAKP